MKIVAISGGLGNQLFQYFFAIKLNQKYREVYICKKFYDNQPSNTDKRIFELDIYDNDLIKIKENNFTNKYNSYFINKLEKTMWYFKHLILDKQKFLLINFNFFNLLFPLRFLLNNNYFYGAYHNKINKNQIDQFVKFLDNLEIKKKYKDFKFKNYYKLITNNNSVAICIRRGDFLNFNSNSSDQFFFDSIKFLNDKFDNLSFFFFSDDMIWVKKNFHSKNFYYVDLKNKPSHLNIILISLCNHAVISNSTLHLCGASLIKNKNSMIIYEKEWKLAEKFNFIKFSHLAKS